MELKLLAAGRGDYSEQELHPTWRIENEIILPFKHDLRLGGYVGTAFSQPSLFDMYWIGDSETQGNPNLKSESSTGFSLYSVLGIGRVNLKLAYYYNHVDNLIQWRQYYMNGVSWKPFNVGTADIRNFEAETDLRLGKHLSFISSVTFTDAVDKSTNPDGSPSPTYDKKLVYTPDTKVNARLSFGGEKLGASLSYAYTGRQYSTVDNLIEPLSAFYLFDAAAYYVLPLPFMDVRLDIKANNLLDKRYDIYAYTPQPGFNWSGMLSLSTKSYSGGK
jgi:outer membrane cobalamin receptor